MESNRTQARLLSIAILGQYDQDRPPRRTIATAIEHAANALNIKCSTLWINNSELSGVNFNEFDGFFIAPGGPDEDMDHIFSAITFSRTANKPTLGTCGGFQRMVSEFAMNVLNMPTVCHQEIEPDAVDAVFTGLTCGITSEALPILIKPDTLAERCYQKNSALEQHYCRFGLNTKFIPDLMSKGMLVSGTDAKGVPRIIEIENHPFMLGTLFVPQVQSTPDSPHPLLIEFIRAMNLTQSTDTSD